MKFDSTRTRLGSCVVAVWMRKMKKRENNISNIYLHRNKNQFTKIILQPQHIITLLYLLDLQLVYKSTFQSIPFSLKRRVLAKIQHHIHMACTTCNNERERMKKKCQQKIWHVKNKNKYKTKKKQTYHPIHWFTEKLNTIRCNV